MDKDYMKAKERVEQKHPGFSKLDSELQALSCQPPSFFTLSLLRNIVQWKLWRGKFRPRLLALVQTNTHVEQWSELIMRAPTDTSWTWIETTIQKLVKEFKGVGPATASAILSFFHDSVPFMSDELLEAAKVKKPWKYSMKEYTEAYHYLDKLEKKTGQSKRNLE